MTKENFNALDEIAQINSKIDDVSDLLKLIEDKIPLEDLDALQAKEFRLIEEIERIRKNRET